MDKSEVSPPIATLLDGANYVLCSEQIKIFLIGRKLWWIMIKDIVQPVREENENDVKYAERLKVWDNKNH